MPEKYVRDGGLPILLRHTGASTLPQDPPVGAEGRAIVCLHDAGLQSSVFVDLLAALAAERRARAGASAEPTSGPGRSDAAAPGSRSDAACSLSFDLPGHGRSGGLDALPSIGAMTDCARRVTGWCRASRPLLVGHGMGALVALDWAARAPESVGGLVLCGTSTGFGVRDEALALMREVTRGRAPRPFDPRRLAPDCDPGRIRRAWLESIQTDPRATLVDLEASRDFARSFEQDGRAIDTRRDRPSNPERPILVVAGACEPEADRASARALADRLGGRFLELEQSAHWLPLEQPAALARAVLDLAEAA